MNTTSNEYSFIILYVSDCENDKVELGSDIELKEAVKEALAGKNFLRLYVDIYCEKTARNNNKAAQSKFFFTLGT